MEGREGLIREPVSAIEKLKPQEFVDADGAKRQLFTFKNKQNQPVGIIFYAKEDLPFSTDVLKGKEGFVLGRPPNFREQNEWNGFLKDVQSASETHHFPLQVHSFNRQKAIESGKAVFFVENNPVSILDMAFILGLEGVNLREARKKAVVDRRFSPEILEIIDNAITGTAVDNTGKLRKREDQEGEALTLLSLMGDEEAVTVLKAKRQALEASDLEKKKKLNDWASKTVTRLEQQGIAPAKYPRATHSTKYRPVITEEGIEIMSSFDATGGKLLRNTVHFSLAGPVDNSLGGGGWDEMDYVISGDLRAIKDRNGNPRKISEIDTYFTVSPGERLIIPNAHLRMPGWLHEGILRENRGRITIYKNQDLTARDIDALLIDSYDRTGFAIDLAQQKIRSCFNLVLWSSKVNDGKSNQREGAYIAFIDKLDSNEVLQNMRELGIKKAVDQSVVAYSDADEKDKIQLARRIEAVLVTAIRNGGFYSTTGSSEGSRATEELLMLAASWGAGGDTSRQGHFNDPEGLGMEASASYPVLRKLKEAKETLARYDSEHQDGVEDGKLITPRFFYEHFEVGYGISQKKLPINDRVKIMEAVREGRGFLSGDAKTRRMHYLAGII